MDLARTVSGKTPKPPRVKARWTKPVQNFYKINVDASFREMEMQGATGFVVRDHLGQLIVAQALWYAHAASLMAMEAWALRDGVRFVLEKGYNQVAFESDAQEVIKLVNEAEVGRSEIANITQEIEELSAFFTSYNFSHIFRDTNVAAHLCAN
jgi:ribonuclease HI